MQSAEINHIRQENKRSSFVDKIIKSMGLIIIFMPYHFSLKYQ